MQITIDTHNLTDLDRELLARLAGTAPMPARVPRATLREALGGVAAAAAAVAEKVAAPAPVAKEAGDDPADVAEPELPFSDPEAPTMADALAAATQAVSSGGSAKVKAALASVNSKRVSEMKVEDIPAFLAALSAG